MCNQYSEFTGQDNPFSYVCLGVCQGSSDCSSNTLCPRGLACSEERRTSRTGTTQKIAGLAIGLQWMLGAWKPCRCSIQVAPTSLGNPPSGTLWDGADEAACPNSCLLAEHQQRHRNNMPPLRCMCGTSKQASQDGQSPVDDAGETMESSASGPYFKLHGHQLAGADRCILQIPMHPPNPVNVFCYDN